MISLHCCTFIGHSDCNPEITSKLYDTIEKLIKDYNVTTFYVGTHGKFDYYSYTTLCELEKIYKINILVVISHLNNIPEYCNSKNTVFPEAVQKTPYKYAIIARNNYMIDKSEFIICYIEHTFSNTYKFVKTAIGKKLNIINLGQFDLNRI